MSTVARDARAFERMYRRHVPAVYRYALAVLGNQADAEDATQQTFLSAYRAWERGERPRRAHNWLITIAHNVCRQRFRERSRRPAQVELEADAVPASVDERLEAADLMTALGQLQFNQRAALVMRELEGRSYDEIAGTLGVSHSAVETLLFRARRALREQLEGELTCTEAEHALSRRLDGELPRGEAAALRAHTRGCGDCATLERRMRARRAALRGWAFPLPSSLGSSGAGATTAAGGGLLAKGAAVLALGALAAGVGTHAVQRHGPLHHAAAMPDAPVAVATLRRTGGQAPVRHTATTAAARRVQRTPKPAPSPRPAARPQPAAPAPSSTATTTAAPAPAPSSATTTTAAPAPAPTVVATVPTPTLPAPPPIAAAVAATPPVTLPATVTVTVPQVTTVTVPPTVTVTVPQVTTVTVPIPPGP